MDNKTWFQFHEGPIKTQFFPCEKHHIAVFQFHEGPIKTLGLAYEKR